jgi:fumarate reductase subunit D
MRNIKWQALIAILLLGSTLCMAQAPMNGDEPVQMADAMHANGKIYAVVAVVVLIVTGILLYLIRLDRKISRLEKEA